MSRVATIHADASAAAAALAMRREAVGCLVVVDSDDRPVGALTDRDLCVRAVAKSSAPATLVVSDLASSPLVTTPPTATTEDLLLLMKQRGIRRVAVVEGDRVVGLVTLDALVEDLSRDIRSLMAEAPRRYRGASAAHRFDHVRASVEHGLQELRSKLEYAQWYARETLVDELDELRNRLRDG